MAESGLRQLARASIHAVGDLLESEPATVRLTAKELANYATRRPGAGWRVVMPLASGTRRLDVLLCHDFPWSPPIVALVDRPPFLTWPHVEHDGTLCLLGNEASFDPSNPVGVVRYLLVEAARLVERLTSGELTEDFRHEFQSYWAWSANGSAIPTISLCNPAGPSRKIRCWMGQHLVILADNDENISSWLVHRGRHNDFKPPATVDAVLAVLAKPPLPSEYPSDGSSLAGFLKHAAPEAAAMMQDLTLQAPNETVLAMCAQTDRGPTMATVIIPKPQPLSAPGFRGPDPTQKGFRRGRIPPETAIKRFMSGNRALRMKTERADASWIHGRGHDAGFEQLRETHVAFVGCGSLGSPAMRLLAQAGLGKITIIDPDRLGWPNVGRHALGADEIGSYKATAMATALRRDFPHIHFVDPITERVEQLLIDGDPRIAASDLIVSTTGSWSSNAALSDWAAEAGIAKRVLIGWTEPYACAGHAVVLLPKDGCIHCGFNKTGVPDFRVTDWETGTHLRQEPACGNSYQPYGPIEASLVASMIADTVLDVVLGEITASTHRMWGARKPILQRNEGRWTSDWLNLAPHADAGGIVLERPWRRTQACFSCQSDLAA